LQLNPDLVAAIKKFFTVPNLGQVIVLVDINPKLDLFELRPARPFVFVVLGKIVAEFSKRNDFADRRIGSRSDFDQVEPAALRFSQGVR